MAATDTSPASLPDGRPLAEAIALFEGILQTAPDDRVALEALAVAYERNGDVLRSRAMLVRLARVLVRRREREAAAALARRLESFVADDFDALEALRSIETMLAAESDAPHAAPSPPPPPAIAPFLRGVALRRQVLSRELGLAWELLQAGELSQDEYAAVVEELSRRSGDDRHTIISFLHVLADIRPAMLERFLLAVARRRRCPVIALAGFEPQPDALAGMPPAYAAGSGTLPFDKIGDELMVAVLNPPDDERRRELEAQLGRRCHFFLARPDDFDAACARLQAAAGETPDTPPASAAAAPSAAAPGVPPPAS
jgi:hypothetical protein